MSDPIPPDPQEQYAALIKVGDAIETPDGALWVVETVRPADLDLVSAYRQGDVVYADRYEPTTTTIPKELARKVVDARLVRRP